MAVQKAAIFYYIPAYAISTIVAKAHTPPIIFNLVSFSLKNITPMRMDSSMVDVLQIPYNEDVVISPVFIDRITKYMEPKLNEPSNIPKSQALNVKKLRKVPFFTMEYMIPHRSDIANSVAVKSAASS